MAIETWFPVGYVLPGGASCRRATFGAEHWQILTTEGGGTALVVHEELVTRWRGLKLVDEGTFTVFPYGTTRYGALSCGPGESIVPVDQSKSPDSRNEAVAFAAALKATREIDPDSALQDAIYAPGLGRLLPTFSLSPRAGDDVILGYWLTGGAHVSAKSTRRLNQLMSWLTPKGVSEVVALSAVHSRYLLGLLQSLLRLFV